MCSHPIYPNQQLRNRSGSIYSNWEQKGLWCQPRLWCQRGGPAQYPVQALVTATPISPPIKGLMASAHCGQWRQWVQGRAQRWVRTRYASICPFCLLQASCCSLLWSSLSVPADLSPLWRRLPEWGNPSTFTAPSQRHRCYPFFFFF